MAIFQAHFYVYLKYFSVFCKKTQYKEKTV